MDIKEDNSMRGINSYGRELTKEQIDNEIHRSFVGGLWEEVGLLQFEFLKAHGLLASHKLLDVGCGCLRGGIHYIKYLEEGNYYGLDVNRSLIEAGLVEINNNKLEGKHPVLLVDDLFRFSKFQQKFDFMVSVSLFTHLPMNIIIRCLCEARRHLTSGGIYFSTFFEAPNSAYIDKLQQNPGGIITNYDSDPFHYSYEELSWMARVSGLNFNLIGNWGHPRNQKMASFSLKL